MGLSIKTCSCLKSSQEQNSEFRPILNTSSKNDNSMYQSNRRTPAMKSNNNKIFTFGKGKRPSNLSNQIKIQTSQFPRLQEEYLIHQHQPQP